eukprot:2925030-Pyramimonas_sp.AAC.1
MDAEARASALRLSGKLVSVPISCLMGLRPLAGARIEAYLTQDPLCFSPLVRWATTRAAASRLPSQRWLGGAQSSGTHAPCTVLRKS